MVACARYADLLQLLHIQLIDFLLIINKPKFATFGLRPTVAARTRAGGTALAWLGRLAPLLLLVSRPAPPLATTTTTPTSSDLAKRGEEATQIRHGCGTHEPASKFEHT